MLLYTLQVLQDVTAEEFQQFVDVLLQLRTTATRKGAQDLVDIVANQADLSSDFQVSTVAGLMITASHQTFSSQIKHLSGQTKFGHTNLQYNYFQ